MASPSRHLVLTVHGIRTYGRWQERLEIITKTTRGQEAVNGALEFAHYKYGYFTILGLLVPFLRKLALVRFRRDLKALLQNVKPIRIDIVAHSFGAYLVADALRQAEADSGVHVHTLILAAGVIPPDHGLGTLRASRVINDCGLRDRILLLTLFAFGLGMGGRLGLHGFENIENNPLVNRYFRFGHSGYFEPSEWGGADAFMERWWVPLLLKDSQVERNDQRPAKPSYLDRFWRSLGENNAATTLTIYAVLSLVLIIWFVSLWAAAESARRDTERERDAALLAQSRFLTDVARREDANGNYVTAALLTLEGLPRFTAEYERPYLPEAEAVLYASLLDATELHVLSHEVTTGGVSWSEPQGSAQDVSTDEDSLGLFLGRMPLGQHIFNALGGVRLVFSGDGTHLATTANDGARLWDANTGQQLAILKAHTLGVESAAFSPDGTRLVTASADSTARIWDVNSATEIAALHGHTGILTTASFSPDGGKILTASWDGTIRVWDATTGQQLSEIYVAKQGVTHALFTPDGARIIAASGDDVVREVIHILDAEDGREIARLTGFSELTLTLAVSSDGRRIGATSIDGTARLWDAKSGAFVSVLAHDRAVSLAFSPDGSRLVVGSKDGLARIYDASSGAEVGVLRGHTGIVFGVAYGPSGALIATASNDKSARLWNPKTLTEVRALRGHVRGVFGVTFSPNGSLVATMAFDGTARLWATNPPLFKMGSMLQSETAIRGLRQSGWRLIDLPGDRSIRILDAQSKAELLVLKGHKGSIYDAVFSPDGNRIVSASYDGTARVWDTKSGKEIIVLRGHEGPVRSAAFSPDGKHVATGSSDHSARVWDIATGSPVAVIANLAYEVSTVSFNDDGTELVTGANSGSPERWRVFPATIDIVRYAEKVVPRCLTPRQRVQYSVEPEPPRWCIEWQKWPYDTQAWKRWLAAKDNGHPVPMPESAN